MKKTIIAIILYVLILHVFLPSMYYLVRGFTPIYSDFIDIPALIKSFLLISIPLLLAISILLLLPANKDVIRPSISGKPVTFLFYFSILLKMLIIIIGGGFQSAIAGDYNGTFANYISLFFSPFTLLLVLLFVQKQRSSILFAVFLYVVSITLSGSRSGIISIFFVFFIGLSFEMFKQYQKKLVVFLKYSLLLTPFVFLFATKLRGIEGVFSLEFLLNQIIGRMSTLETAMLPVFHYDHDLDLVSFYDKFSVWSQFKLVLDSVLPGQLFAYDVMPNNYYRHFFLGYSKDFVFENYMSVNLTLPIYLYLKYNLFSIILTVIYIVGFYKLVVSLRKYPLIIIMLLSTFYNLIYFFDWVMVFSGLYISFLTIVTLKVFVLFVDAIKAGIIKNRKNEIV